MREHNCNNNINLLNLAKELKNAKALSKLQTKFYKKLGLKAIAGAEIEFYLAPSENIKFLEKTLGFKFIKEKGSNQWEVNFPPQEDLEKLVILIDNFKLQLETLGRTSGEEVNFKAKPYKDDYGSALHIHLNFINKKGANFCANEGNLTLIANSLCSHLDKTFLVFAPNTDSYNRFDQRFMAPINISYGPNNRTTAIRIPDSYPKRIEHRVAGSDADPYLVVYSIFKAVYLGLLNTLEIPLIEKTYGNAYDMQYNLKSFPSNIIEAEAIFNTKFFEES
ncbi:MAG: glnA [Rickettsiaceae bacterium]|jgi:glutamine synthetase|nr:glnA [Rickettsiaceae bacterium]